MRGAVVELGCYVGTTSLFIRRVLERYGPDVPFHVYDSFAGLPPKTVHDNSPAGLQFVTGELEASKKAFVMSFKKAGLHVPVIHKLWFSELNDAVLPDAIRFAFLDGDYYESIKDSLAAIEGRLTEGAVVIVDDYHNEALPGAKKAVDQWLKAHPEVSSRVERSLMIMTL